MPQSSPDSASPSQPSSKQCLSPTKSGIKRRKPDSSTKVGIKDVHQKKRYMISGSPPTPPTPSRERMWYIPKRVPANWMPPRQAREQLVEFRALPHQYRPLQDERSTFQPPMEEQRPTHIPQPRFIPDNAYGEQPPVAIERDIREGLEPIQENKPILVDQDIVPTNQQDNINDMYSNAWFRNHMSNAVEATDHIVPKQY